MHTAFVFDLAQAAGVHDPSLTVPAKPALAVGLRRIVLSQPPHYGRIGAQPEHVKPDPVQSAADAAVKAAQWDREKKTRRNGIKSTVR